MPVRAVPQELVDLIVDNLEGQTDSLKSCSLAASPFVGQSQIHLFKKVEFLPPSRSGDNPCKKFHQSITSSPHLAALVQELRIVTYDAPVDPNAHNLPECWVAAEGTLLRILPLLQLKGISIVDNDMRVGLGRGPRLDWNRLDESLRSALATVLSSATLESVRLRDLIIRSPRELLSLFGASASLRSLSISRVQFSTLPAAGKHDTWPHSEIWRPRLTCLLVSDLVCGPFGRHFWHPQIDLSGVVTLRFACVRLGVIEWEWERRIPAFHDLENLALFHPRPEAFQAIVTPNLRSLHIYSAYGLDPDMMSIFRAVPLDSRLENITLDGAMISPFRVDSVELNDAIDTVLTCTRTLRMVQLRVTDGTHGDFLGWSELARRTFHSLERRDLLITTQATPDAFSEDWT
ncbi:hypothetical protein FB45DRAFT_946503 [Roridomyces roridus]|uniref:Uncharacterized protein n=1 Tax=Roridomyces roridus TaxID=1738132 RepID=A0AAD7B235_9AGAR|nr:hypothetical protein FB45DRAFT_946503 [Roridomyces roridus]